MNKFGESHFSSVLISDSSGYNVAVNLIFRIISLLIWREADRVLVVSLLPVFFESNTIFEISIVNYMKMKPLRTNQRVLIWLYAYPTERTDEQHDNCSHIAFTSLVFTVYIGFLIASIAYFIKFSTIDLNETLYATIQITAALPMMKALVIMILKRRKFRDLFESLSRIYDASECHQKSVECEEFPYFTLKKLILAMNAGIRDGWIELFDEINQKCEWIWHFFIKYVIGGFIVGIISKSSFSVLVS